MDFKLFNTPGVEVREVNNDRKRMMFGNEGKFNLKIHIFAALFINNHF